MASVKSLVRRLFHAREGDDAADVNLRLRKAVEHARPRQVAALLDEGASPVWMPSPAALARRSARRHARQLNALLLACQFGDVTVLALLMDALFAQPDVLRHFARAMYSLVIRHGHWRAFLLLRQRRFLVDDADTNNDSEPVNDRGDDAESATDYRSANAGDLAGILFGSCSNLLHLNPYALKLPLPAFVAAEYGRREMLEVLIKADSRSWREYTFKGHTMLTVSTKNGHYECVELLLAHVALTREALDIAVACAKRYRQAHVLVLLTSCLPEFQPVSNEPLSDKLPRHFDDVALPPKQGRFISRGSLAETVASDGEGDIDTEGEFRRSSMVMWLMDDRDSADSVKRHMSPDSQTRDVVAIMRSARSRSHEKRVDHRQEEPKENRRLQFIDRDIQFAHGWNMPPVGFLPSLSTRSYSGHSSESGDDDDHTAYKPFHDEELDGESETDESECSPPAPTPLSVAVALAKSPPMAPLSAPAPMPSPKVISIRSHSMKMRRSLPAIDESENEADA
jgi:hypothetical protein